MPLGFLELVAAFRDPSEYALQEPVEADAECCEDYDDYSVIQNICKALRHPHLSGKYVAEPFNERCHSEFFNHSWQHPCKNIAPGLQRGRVLVNIKDLLECHFCSLSEGSSYLLALVELLLLDCCREVETLL